MSITIVVDTREKRPLVFPGVKTVVGTVKAGDYTLRGYAGYITVERKSLSDYHRWITGSNFEAQVKKLKRLRYRTVVVEAQVGDQNTYCAMDPFAVARRTALINALQIPVAFMRDRELAAQYTLWFLKWAKQRIDTL